MYLLNQGFKLKANSLQDITQNKTETKSGKLGFSHAAKELWPMFRLLKPHLPLLISAVVLLVLNSMASLGFAILAGNILDATSVSLQGLKPANWRQDINITSLVLLGLLLVQSLFGVLQAGCFGLVGSKTMMELRYQLHSHFLHLPMSFHGQSFATEIPGRVATDLFLLREVLIEAFPRLLPQLLILIGGGILICMMSIKLTMLMLITIPPFAFLIWLMGRYSQQNSRLMQDLYAICNRQVQENFQMMATIKAFANESFEENRYLNSLQKMAKAVVKMTWYYGWFGAACTMAIQGGMIILLWYGAHLVITKELTLGQLGSFLLLTFYLRNAIWSCSDLFIKVQKVVGGTERLRGILNELRENSNGKSFETRPNGKVAFEQVSFTYPNRQSLQVLKNISLEVKPGELVAIVGESGSGKSTMMSLVLRFFEPDSGRILIDDHNIRDISLDHLRKHLAIVQQEVLLFSGTIGENISYGKIGASQEEIERVAKMANAHDFIIGFPEGYQTLVGERGTQLSGGQRQRIAIARALLRDPSILILDEATSSLDSKSEKLVLQAMDRLAEGRTSFVIAHRLATVRNADRVVVIHHGQIVETGSHDDLASRPNGEYSRLLKMQGILVEETGR